MSYIDIYRAEPVVRIGMIKAGVPAAQAKRIFHDLAISQGAGLSALKLSAATVNRKASQDATLSADESERVIGVAKLVGQLQAMVEESGDPQGFDAPAWLSRWLREPLPALGGQAPMTLLDTMEGQSLVSRTLSQIQSGAYA
ncbi:antitoxin Xre/MbcA/ParS toxin-binding domain-containing protein [Caulobacter sp. NIBR1757]|uniref:type II RES/Xre toxin-antitoxin system antitoxin n=1 Tax=Caulobacter sp. NIBR1757 TaxID=3016000 RepID=UPI0022F1074E|nr:antitoxin Xre/MbcA/ParS toxin-binding domain-containing protein [Caulobacter sp. NIBR1757]